MKKIKLLGISEDQNYEWWKGQLFEVLEKINMGIEVEEVNSVDEFVEFNVSSVPSILINNEIVLEQNGHIVSADEIEAALQPFLKKNPITMKKIIVPVDFSNTARNALLYAENLSAKTGNPIKVVNICHPTAAVFINPVADMDSLINIQSKRLEEFICHAGPGSPGYAQLKETSVQVESEVISGFAKSEILKLSEREDTEMIVMGATGLTNAIGQIFGGIASEVALKSKAPVMLVPEHSKFKPFQRILYASNFDSANDEVVEELYQLANKFNSMVHFIHVNEKDKKEDFTEIEGKIFARLWADREPTFPFEMKSINSKSVFKGINTFASQEDVDLIVVANRHRSLWDQITKESTTLNLAVNIRKPILVHHVYDKYIL